MGIGDPSSKTEPSLWTRRGLLEWAAGFPAGTTKRVQALLKTQPEAGAVEFRTDHPVPQPGAGWVRVRVAAAAICGTDRHIYHWDPSVQNEVIPPVVIGHEFCGHVDATGDGVEGWAVGDYVSAEMHVVCGECRACRAGNHHVCAKTRICGLSQDGAFAEYVVVPASNLVRLDASVVPPPVGAFLDALGNAVHTVQSASGVTDKHVLVSGYGAIGAMAAAVVEFEGAASITITEVASNHIERAHAWAATLGRSVPVYIHNPLEEGSELAETIRKQTGGGVDVVLEMSGAPPAIDLGFRTLYPGGEMLQLGIPASANLTVADFNDRFIFPGITWKGVIGRRMFSTWDRMLGLLARGMQVEHIVTHRLPLQEFHDGIALLDSAEAHKVVLTPTA